MPPELIPDDEDYASSEDSDFAPETAPTRASDDSSDEDSATEAPVKSVKQKPGKRKRGLDEEAEDAGFENSGDEAIIEKGLKRQKKKAKKGKDAKMDDDEGGEGGLIKTRSMRAQEKVENQRPLVDTTAATVDVDALWSDMISGKPLRPSAPIPSIEPNKAVDTQPLNPESGRVTAAQNNRDARSSSTLNDGPDAMIMIKRTYNFAGKIHTEQKLVARSSAEARLYLASQKEPDEPVEDSTYIKPKRPTKKARRSVFEPVTEIPKRTDLFFGVRKDSGIGLLSGEKEAKKLNTVEKSAMDWAGFVDKEGIKDDLDAAGKAKGAYRARQEFLARVESKRDEEERRARGLASV